MIITYYGNGKGKTTAALGLVLRASGYNKRILVGQFVKSPQSVTGEDKALKLIPNLKHKKFGLGFVGIYSDKKLLKEHQEAAQKGLDYLGKNLDKFDVIVADELLGAIKGGLVSIAEVVDLIKSFPTDKDLVLTGRPKYQKIISLSDLVTEMAEVKHPFKRGKMAKEGIDF